MKNFVNSLKDFRTYTTDISIVSIDKKSKQPKKGNLILYIGNIPNEDLVTTLNSGVLFYNNFRSIYKPRNYYSANKKIKRLNLQKDYYKLLPELGFHDAYDTRLNIQSYLDRNLIIDLTEFISVEMQSMSGKNLSVKGAAFKAAIQHMVDSVGYENTTLLINASATSAEAADGKVFNDNFTTIIRFLRRNINFLPEGKVDTIIFHNPQKRSLLKIAITEENIAKVFGDKVPTVLINRLLQLSASTDELTKEENEEVEKEKTTTDDEEATTSSVSSNHTATTPGQKPLASQSTPAKPTRTKKGQAEFEEKVNNASLRALTMLKGKISDEDKKSLTSSIEKSLNEVNIDHISKNDDDELLDLALRHNPEISEHIMAIIKASEIGSNNVKRQHAHAENMKKTAELMSSSKIRDLVEKAKSSSIDDEPLKQAHNVNPEMNKTLRTNEFDRSYASKKFMSDIVNVFNSFSDDSDIPLNIIDFQVEETSDDQNSKETMYITMKDDMNVKHKLTIDIPKVYDGKYIKINGGKKIINKMLVMLPIVKTKPNEVWITTDYNKLIIERFGRKTNSQVDYLSRVIDKIDYRKHTGIRYRRGNSLTVNTKYKTSLEYSELSQRILSLEFGDFRIIFNQKLLADEIATGKGIKNYDYDTNKYFPVGFYKKRNLILSNITDGTLYILSDDSTYDIVNTVECKSFNLSTFIITSLDVATDGELKSLLSFSVKSNESLTFSRVKIINKRIPMIVLLGYEVGLFNVLDRYGVDYQVTTKEPRLSIQDNKSKIKFEDGWLVYDSSKVRNTLLLSGLRVLNTEEYSISEFNGKDPYLDYFQNEFNSRNVSKGVHNAMTLLLDPITKEILKEMELPTNVIDLLLTANTMLEDLESRQFNDMNIYRMRGTEQIPALLYKIVAESYKNYKDSMNNRNPIKVSVPSNILIKNLMELSTVDEASDLNPSLEIDKQTAVTYRGVSGRNSADSYTEEIRGYDKSMEGILGITTPDSATVGVVRQLSTNPNIKSVRGFLDTSGDTTNSTAAYTPLELLTSYTSRHADPPRIGMHSTQAKHVVSTLVNDRALVTSGMHRLIPYEISDVFAVKAKANGEITEIDTETGLMLVEYQDGKKDIFDMNPHMNKNSTGGFFTLQPMNPLFKVGDKFKEGDILLSNPNFFDGTEQGDISYTIGTLAKVSLTPTDGTYEDSSMVTSALAKKMTTKINMKKSVTLGTKANLQFIATEGQGIKTGDPLLIFENEFDDDSVNDLLANIGDAFDVEIQEMTNKVLKSKYTGKVTKINIYFNHDLEEYSESIQKILKGYIAKNKKKLDKINSVKDNLEGELPINLDIGSIQKTEQTKIGGEEFDGLLVEIFVEYEDELGVGDKISFNTALKTVVSDVFPEGEEPFSDFRPDEPIDAFLSPLSVVSRMTTDYFSLALTNKVLIELKRSIADIMKK